ncbi:MAG: 7-cyano-7-deazaguanine synthase [Myxococcota bacterium]
MTEDYAGPASVEHESPEGNGDEIRRRMLAELPTDQKLDRVVVLFSGGTDSMLTAALAAERFDEVFLVTYHRLGLAGTENSARGAEALANKYGADRIHHEIIDITKLFKHVSYERYLQNLRKHKLFLLSTCGLCKLSMHIRTLIYCEDHGIKHVCDGANKGMNLFPAQMVGVLEIMKDLYADFGISYTNPVYDYEPPADKSLVDREGMGVLKTSLAPVPEPEPESRTKTTGFALMEKGLAPNENVKGSKYDRERQPRCFQFTLFNIFAVKHYLGTDSEEGYRAKTAEFMEDKVEGMRGLLEGYRESGPNSKLGKLVK